MAGCFSGLLLQFGIKDHPQSQASSGSIQAGLALRGGVHVLSGGVFIGLSEVVITWLTVERLNLACKVLQCINVLTRHDKTHF